MTDAELLDAEWAMRQKAWDAPKSLPGTYNDAFARFGEAWCDLHREAIRRGLSPSTSDPGNRLNAPAGSAVETNTEQASA